MSSRKRSSKGRPKKKMSRNRDLGSRNRDLGSRNSRTGTLRTRRCKNLLKKKVEKNLKEYGQGKYSSRSQAIAVAYSQVKKMSPSCRKVFRRKSRK
jgi:hypothetical protein